MNSVERTWTTIRLGQPDRVPVDLHNFQPAAVALGLPLDQVFRDGELLADAMIQAWREFGHDVLLVENGTGCVAEACGVGVVYRPDAAPVAIEPVLNELADVDGLRIPDPYTTYPMSEMLKATRIVARELGDRAFIMGRADQAPFSLAMALRGMDRFLLDIATGEEPERIHQLLDFCCQVTTRYAAAQIEQGAHATAVGDSPAGPDLISPRHYRTYAHPYERRMVADLSRQGIVLAIHICGKVDAILDDFVDTGAQILEIDHKTDMHRAKEAIGGKACLLGPIDTALLAGGTPREVEDACREALAILAPGGGLIFGPGCALSPETPAANIHALIEAARRYGVYGS